MASLNNTIELLTDVIDSFKVRFPMITAMGTDFSSEEARLGDTVRGRIVSNPTVSTYDGDTGYKNGATEANSLTTDIDITLSNHKHVPIKVDYLDQIKTRRNIYQEVVGNMSYALGKDLVDTALGLVTLENFEHEAVATEGNSDYDALSVARQIMNGNGAGDSRLGVVNSAVFSSLEVDARIASGDYHGQLRGAQTQGVLTNVGGFEAIYEYAGMPANSENLTGFFTDKTGLIFAARVPTDMDRIASDLGVPSLARTEVVTDPDTGLSLMSITYQDPHTFDLYSTVTWVYGIAAGAQAAADDSLTSKGSVRLVTAANSGATSVTVNAE